MLGAVSAPAERWLGILLFDGVEELDAVGPWEVLLPDRQLDDLPPLEVLVHPGGRGTQPQLEDAEHLERIRQWRRDVPLMTSVCTGSLVFAAAGLLKGRPATSHHTTLQTLAELDPSVEVRADDRYVDDGDLVTSAGVSAGIDMALHLVVRLAGPDRARQVRRGIQYDPEPPV
jgi:transcriptional regulator GlxA family with amidase domain